MFRRRERPSPLVHCRDFLWPRAGWRRTARYLAHRIGRLPGTPHGIAAGFGIGAAVSFTPFIGFHFVLALLGALVLRVSLPAALAGTLIGNPWSFPFIWAWIHTCGSWMLGLGDEGMPNPAVMTALWSFTVSGIDYLGGSLIFGARDVALYAKLDAHWQTIVAVTWPMILGSLPNLPLVWLLFYLPGRRLVTAYRNRRLIRMKRRETAFREPKTHHRADMR